MEKSYQELINMFDKGRVKVAEELASHTTFKIGGVADLFFEAETEEEIVKVLRKAKELGLPYFVLGGGSNVLIGDKGFRGLVIKIAGSDIKTGAVFCCLRLRAGGLGIIFFSALTGATY